MQSCQTTVHSRGQTADDQQLADQPYLILLIHWLQLVLRHPCCGNTARCCRGSQGSFEVNNLTNFGDRHTEVVLYSVFRSIFETSHSPAMADALEHLSSGRTRIEWLSSLNTEFQPKKHYRRTSIICTIGTQDPFRDGLHGLLQRTNKQLGPKTNSAAKINILRKGIMFT